MGSKTSIGTIDETVISLTVLDHQTLIFVLPDVTYLLTMLVTDTIASHSSLLDSYVVLHAAFVSSLHKILGLEFGRKKHFKKLTGMNANVIQLRISFNTSFPRTNVITHSRRPHILVTRLTLRLTNSRRLTPLGRSVQI